MTRDGQRWLVREKKWRQTEEEVEEEVEGDKEEEEKKPLVRPYSGQSCERTLRSLSDRTELAASNAGASASP